MKTPLSSFRTRRASVLLPAQHAQVCQWRIRRRWPLCCKFRFDRFAFTAAIADVIHASASAAFIASAHGRHGFA
jgi:hypothetical protein